MSLPKLMDEDFTERRRRLTAQIARQRGEFSQAYAKLEQPIRYTDYGLRGVGFLRSNPWIFAAVPAAVGIVKTLLSGAPAKSVSSRRRQEEEEPKKKGGVIGFATGAAHQGWKLFQLYRRIRSYLP